MGAGAYGIEGVGGEMITGTCEGEVTGVDGDVTDVVTVNILTGTTDVVITSVGDVIFNGATDVRGPEP